MKVGDKIAAAVLTYKRAALRVGVIEKVHPPKGSINQERYTIRDKNGDPHIVSSARAVMIEADEHHTMEELYTSRMMYNAHAMAGWYDRGAPVGKAWRHYDGELCFGGGWFIVYALTPDGWVTNHYKAEHWDLFDVPDEHHAPKWDGHTTADVNERLRRAL